MSTTQRETEVDEDGSTAAERAAWGEFLAEQRAWEQARSQQAVTFSERLPNTPASEMNTWLLKHPKWRVAQMTSATYSVIGDYGATWTYQYITCLMEKDPNA